MGLQRVDIPSWHVLGATSSGSSSSFLRGVISDLLIPGSATGGAAKATSRFAGDRAYWLRRPSIPGNFEAGVMAVRRTPVSARLVLGVFEVGDEEPALLYVADRVSVDAAGRPAAPDAAVESALQRIDAGLTGSKFGL